MSDQYDHPMLNGYSIIYTVIIENDSVNRIYKTDYFYSASDKSIKIYKEDEFENKIQKFEFKGNYIGKKCCFRIDTKGRFKFMGVSKAPKDPVMKILWEHGFTGSKRKTKQEDVERKGYLTKIEDPDNGYKVLMVYNKNKEWWIPDDLSPDKIKEVMEDFVNDKDGPRTEEKLYK